MSDELYQRLRKAIAQHSMFFNPTPSGVEIQLLKRVFDVEEADMYLYLTWNLETPKKIAERAGQDPETVSAILKRMAEKGLLYPKREGDSWYYAAAPFAHGIAEHQVYRMDREWAELYEQYLREEKIPEEPPPNAPEKPLWPLRTLPVNAPVNVSRPIAPYEAVKDLIQNQDRIAVTKCFCAAQQELLESGCDQPLEVCIMLGFYADYYIELGMGRQITQEEALEILERSEEAGLVHQFADCVDPGCICNCCSDCCAGLRAIKQLPNPAALVISNHYSQVDEDLCNGCAICVDRCGFDAISMTANNVAEINLDRCIGCGLCINVCLTDALTLMSKPEEERQEPPPTSLLLRSSVEIESTLDRSGGE
jgi:NAD-dependent dihydropyrimidine dehydrogenase PreA subunit